VLKTNFDMLLHNTNHRWAYVIVNAPVLEGFVSQGKNLEQTTALIQSAIAELAPQIMPEK
jgi:predicted RNase H-like HicB family nuclease